MGVASQECNQVPYQDCQQIPQQQCNPVHKKVPQRISRTVPKKVCDGAGGSSSGFGGNIKFGNTNGNTPLVRKEVEEEEDFEVFSEKQVNLKSGDAVNSGNDLLRRKLIF